MKIDVSKIEGYSAMTAEEKLKVLEGLEIADPDYSGYVKKEVFDKTASELAMKKKALQDKMTEDEQKAQREKEEREKLQADYEQLLHKTAVSENKAKLLALGYEEKLAGETAEAMANGDSQKVFDNQKKHLEAVEKKIRADALKETPKPAPDGNSNTMTLEKLRKMTVQERLEYSTNHPDEYKTLYGGNE